MYKLRDYGEQLNKLFMHIPIVWGKHKGVVKMKACVSWANRQNLVRV